MFTEELLPFIIWPRAGQLFMVHFLCFMTLWPKFKNPFDLKLIITLINFFKFFIICEFLNISLKYQSIA